ncbi:MAG: hypothetical protein SGARI_006618, partial [Bacillariaceae sp.]
KERADKGVHPAIAASLPIILSSGFLCLDQCLKTASTCKDWYRMWKSVEEGFPEECKVEVHVEDLSSRKFGAPHFVTDNLLASMKSSLGFARHVFDKVNELRVEAKKTPGAKKKCREQLKIWAKDIRYVEIYYWGAAKRNNGGICIDYTKTRSFHASGPSFSGRSVERIRIDDELYLWTVQTMRAKTWESLDHDVVLNPIWPPQDESGTESVAESDSESDMETSLMSRLLRRRSHG